MSTIDFESCRICFNDFVDDKDNEIAIRVHGQAVTPHDFHETCLETWVKTRAHMSHTCPPCRVPLSEQNVTYFKRTTDGRYAQIRHAPLDLSQPIARPSSQPSLFVTLAFVFFLLSLIVLIAKNPPSDDWATQYFNFSTKPRVYP